MLTKCASLFLVLCLVCTTLPCEEITLSYLEKERGKSEALGRAYTAAVGLRRASQKMLSKDEAAHIAWFIETRLPQEIQKDETLFEGHGLAFPVEYDPESRNIFILLGSHKDGYIGKGKKKIVTKALLYHAENPELIANCHADSALENEIIATQLLANKPGLFRVYGITQHKKRKKVRTSFFCKLYNKGSLDSFIKEHARSLTLQEKMGIARNILEGLKHIHEANFVHRDLGARNYLVNVAQDPKTGKRIVEAVIADLGRALPCENAAARVAQGNSAYTAPEAAEIDDLTAKDYFATDIYALGCTLFRLHFHKKELPYVPVKQAAKEGRHGKRLKNKLVKKLRTLLEEEHTRLAQKKIDPQQAKFEKLILQMIHYDPKCRGSAQELLAQLETTAG